MKVLLCLLFVCWVFALPVWESTGPYGSWLRTLAVAPSNQDIIYVVSFDNTAPFKPPLLFKSTDAGDSWVKASSISDSFYVYSLAVDPLDPNIVYAGSRKRIYKSTDGGFTWTQHLFCLDSVLDIAAHPTEPSTIFATGRVEVEGPKQLPCCFKSTDGGISWDTVTLGDSSFVSRCIAIDPTYPDTIYVGVTIGIGGQKLRMYKSIDGGNSYTKIYSKDTTSMVNALRVHPSNSDIVYAALRKKIIRSTDGGNTWNDAYNDTSFSLATTPVAPDIVYAGADSVVYKSTDAGVSWIETGPGIHGKETRGLVVRSDNADVLYAASCKTDATISGFHKTLNGGASWSASNQGISRGLMYTLEIAPSTPSTIYAIYHGVAPGSLFKSTDGGDTWSQLPELPSDCCTITDIAIHNTSADTVLLIEGLIDGAG